ncbi:MAG: LPS assembly lipoprotein LptE [Desulfobulbaceae bacterium]|nr:LPS assembly lipoprotein LptE [Desulfobulbaceae bacterium]
MNLSRTVLILCVCFGLLVGGCGYYFPHVYDGPAKTIYMPNWKNRTSQLGLDAEIYQTLARWFQKTDAISLTKNREEADMILAGEIVNIDLPSVSWDADARTREAKVVLVVRYILKDIHTDEILWEVPREVRTEAYPTSGGAGVMAEEERQALDQIITDMSERIYIGTLNKLRRSSMKVSRAE